MAETVFYWFIAVLLLLPVVPLMVAWSRARRWGWGTGRSRWFAVTSVLSLTLSCALLMVELIVPESIGRHYSGQRFAVIYATGGSSVVATFLACLSGSRFRGPAFAAGVLAAVSWLYLMVVGSVA